MPPPPFGVSGTSGRRSRASSRANAYPETSSAPPVAPSLAKPQFLLNEILKPMTGRDVVALIFILLMLPQGVSCLVLTGYILLGSFKSLAGKVVAKYLVLSTDDVDYDVEATSVSKYRYYRSELLGDVLQLFSINSFILLVCHSTLPHSWLQYLIVLAKSIVASRLVGSYTTGSTTYVSVVAANPMSSSSSSASSTTTTTTSTMTTTTSQQQQNSKNDIKYSTSNFYNSLVGFMWVTALNSFVLDWVLRLNFPLLLSDTMRFYRNLALKGNPDVTAMKTLFTKSPFFISFNYLSSKKGSYLIDNRKLFGKSNLFGKLIIHVSINYLNLGNKSIQTLSFILREFSVVVNYAYLVLCIHVISLTISPFLQRIFIFKDFSKTLDHLLSLTPDVPYSGFKKSGLITNLSRETAQDSVVVINVDLLQLQLALQTAPHKLEVELNIAKSKFKPNSLSNANAVPSSNFKNFSLVPSTNKCTAFGGRSNQTRTIVDRKRSNSNATPSTTIMDKYFTISIQPIWSWLAAIKVLAVAPSLFCGAPTTLKNNGSKFFTEAVEPRLPLAVAHIGESKVVFEILNRTYFDVIYQDGFSVRVNDTTWLYVSLLVGQQTTENEEKVYICVQGLAPMYQYEIDFYAQSLLVGHHVINTTSSTVEPPFINQSLAISPIESLQNSLKFTIESFNNMKLCLKRAKKDENKRVSDLKKQIDMLRTKIDKVGSKHNIEGKISSKLRGLQNSVTQLEHEITDLRQQISNVDLDNGNVEEDSRSEEKQLKKEIAQLEEYISQFEVSTAKLRSNLKGALGDKESTEAKRKKLMDKLERRGDEIGKLNSEVRAMKKLLIGKFQKRQRRINDRFDVILPKVEEATESLSHELASYDA